MVAVMPERHSFKPDTVLVSEARPSPNHGVRVGDRAPDMILLHYTGMADADLALQRLCEPESGVSAHYFIHTDGRIVQLVPEARRAWHAGHSAWAGETDINSCAIGIEIHNPGHEFDYPDFPPRQIAAVITLCRAIMLRRDIRADRVLGHSDVAPERKQDPGEKFPWRLLADSGIGLWAEPARIVKGPSFRLGDRGEVIAKLQEALVHYGYDLPMDGFYDEKTYAVVAAFQRHFRPDHIDGVLDSSTMITLRRMLEEKVRIGAPMSPPVQASPVQASPVQVSSVQAPLPQDYPEDAAQEEPAIGSDETASGIAFDIAPETAPEAAPASET
jgi:N-acetylmuramoyl-L-alanine amidase